MATIIPLTFIIIVGIIKEAVVELSVASSVQKGGVNRSKVRNSDQTTARLLVVLDRTPAFDAKTLPRKVQQSKLVMTTRVTHEF